MTQTSTRGVKKKAGRYHHGELRHAMVETALRIVEEKGVSALTLRELARRLGVSHAAPAHHFADKTVLLQALAVEGFQHFSHALEQAAVTEQEPAHRLVAIGRAYVHFALAHPGFFRVMFGSQVAELKCQPDHLVDASRGAFRILERCVADLLQDNDIAAIERVALAAWSFVHGTATLYLDGPMRFQVRSKLGRKELDRWLDQSLPLVTRCLAATP